MFRGFQVSGLGFPVSCYGFWVPGFGFWVSGSGFRDSVVSSRGSIGEFSSTGSVGLADFSEIGMLVW